MFDPANEGIKWGDDNYELAVISRIYKVFGPFPSSLEDFREYDDPEQTTTTLLSHYKDIGPPALPFQIVSTKEVPTADKEFILKIMKIDPRDRPTAQQLLEDEWFTEESEDTRIPL